MKLEIKEFKSNLTSFDIFKVFKDTEDCIFLDSSKEDSNLSEFSFIGINPIEKIEVFENSIEDGFSILKRKVEENKINFKSNLPLVCGYLGFISYDEGRNLENLPDTSKEDFNIPYMRFNLYKNIIIFDFINNKKYITALVENSYENNIDEIIKEIEEFDFSLEEKIKKEKKENISFNSNFTKDSYIEALKKMKNYIVEGDIYIANMTQRYWCNCFKNSFDIYSKLRKINGAPFSSYINYKDFQIISSSPERFIQIKEGEVITRPIKGTRPRGKTKEDDEKNKNDLIHSEKDKAELLMIVDLERNDLSKTCKNNSVKVTELFKIEEYSTVFHLVSTIKGTLKENKTAVDCIKECYPGGSITGAPKIRAMEIIEELEGLKRNIYTGCIGYFDLRGNSDFNIAIRTIIKKDNKAYFGVGGGITYESNEEEEYLETLDKAKALMEALR